MSPELAETIALEALGWIVADDELRPVFLQATGADPAGLLAGAGEPQVLASVLDFLLLDDRTVLRFAAEQGRRPSDAAAARMALPGMSTPHWT